MEEQINRRSVLIVFSGMLLVFLFFYKGFILAGDNYADECTAYVESYYDRTTTKTGMKKPMAGSGNIGAQPIAGNAKKDIVVPRNLIYEVLQNLENLKLNVGALQHSIEAKSSSIRDKIKEIPIKSDASIANVNKVVEELEKESGGSIERMIESLSKEIVVLRTMMKDTN